MRIERIAEAAGRLRAKILFVIAVACLIALFSANAPAETLRSVIAQSEAPPDARSLANLDRDIVSYAVLDNARWFAVAYYLQGSSDGLEGPLLIDRYDRAARAWRSASLSGEQTRAGEADCQGSALDFAVAGDSFLLATHINPSAECTLVLSSNLDVRASLYGWPLATLSDGSIVYHRSEIHFAPVHAAEIAVYSAKSGRDYTIYPSKPYQAQRQAEIARLTAFFDAHMDWCNQHNHPCDPEWFDNALDGQVAVNNQSDALAFVIDYGSDADDPGAPPVTVGYRKVVYVVRHAGSEFGFQYREMPQFEVAGRFGAIGLPQLLTPANLQQIFAK